MAAEDSNHVQSVGRALEVLETLRRLDGAGVSELADEMDLTKSTAHAYLQTLEGRGYVEQSEEAYHVGLRFLELGGYARTRLSLFRAARDQVEKLARETGDVAGLGVEDDGMRLLVYVAPGAETVPAFYQTVASVGWRQPLHWTGIGKAILSTKSADEVDAILGDGELTGATEHTITSREALFEDLERSRERGYALEDGEFKAPSRSVAVPIDGREDEPQGAICIAGPTQRLSDERIGDELIPKLQESANIVGLRLSDAAEESGMR